MTRACRGQVALFVDDLGVIVEVVGAIGGFGLFVLPCVIYANLACAFSPSRTLTHSEPKAL